MDRVYDVISFIPRSMYGLFSRDNKNSDQTKQETKPEDPYETLLNQINNFDIMLFNGKNFWFSYVVEYTTWSQFSHIGIVLKSPTWLHPSLTGDYLLESGEEDVPDAVTHKLKFGVQITPLEHIIKNYTGNIYYRNLLSVPYKENPSHYHDILKRIYDMIENKPYDDSVVDLIRIGLHLKLGDCRRTNAFFCSALTSFIFTQLGILPSDTQWDMVEPKDYDTKGQIEQFMAQQQMASLGPLTQVNR